MKREVTFWITIGLIAIAAVALLKLAARSKAGETVPFIGPLADLIAS